MEATPTVLDVFHFEGAGTVRVIRQGDELWFPAVDLARALGYKYPKVAVQDLLRRHPDDFEQEKSICKLSTPGGPQNVIILSEQGAYLFAMLARTPLATKFRRALATRPKVMRRQGSDASGAGGDRGRQSPSAPAMAGVLADLSGQVATLRRQVDVLMARTGHGAPGHMGRLAAVDNPPEEAVQKVLDALRRYARENQGRFSRPGAGRRVANPAGVWWEGKAVGFRPDAWRRAVARAGTDPGLARIWLRNRGWLVLDRAGKTAIVAHVAGTVARVIVVPWAVLFGLVPREEAVH